MATEQRLMLIHRSAPTTMREPEAFHELLTVHEVARYLRVDETTVRRWIKNGSLEAISLPHTGRPRGYRVRKMTLDSLMKQKNEVI